MLVKFAEFLCDCDLCESLNLYFEEKIEKSNPGHLAVAFCDNVPRNSILKRTFFDKVWRGYVQSSKAKGDKLVSCVNYLIDKVLERYFSANTGNIADILFRRFNMIKHPIG